MAETRGDEGPGVAGVRRPSRASIRAALALASLTSAVVIGCHRAPSVRLAMPAAKDAKDAEDVLARRQQAVAQITVCNDSLGIDSFTRGGGSCMPCLPANVQRTPDRGLNHARALWAAIGRAPHDTTYVGASCAELAYQIAARAQPMNLDIPVEWSLLRLASRNDSVRADGLRHIDHVLDSLIAGGDGDAASHVYEKFARGVWDRAERMLQRPAGFRVDAWERDAHDLAVKAPPLRALPRIPRTSPSLGASEAEWSARLFDGAARSTRDVERRRELRRLALTPWVVLARWSSLDSTARAMLAASPNDDVALPAVALAAYHQMRNIVRDGPRVMALFDSALRNMPRADSLAYDGFDDVLAASDDEWRYGFLPADRVRLDNRGWAILDPLWSTPVNEIRLVRRARVADADFRYAAMTMTGQSGSATEPGLVQLRRGLPETAWQVDELRGGGYQFEFTRDWGTMRARAIITDRPSLYRAFYSDHLSLAQAVRWPVTTPGCAPIEGAPQPVVSCVRAQRAEWADAEFWGKTDSLDVIAARFRRGVDSVDLYLGARVPLRSFHHRDHLGVSRRDSITVGAWITNVEGAPVFHRAENIPLPPESQIAHVAQWSATLGTGSIMHRVEALEPSEPRGARGAMRHTSDEQVTFPLTGFGMSDVVIAASARERRAPARRWSDLELVPNGGVVTPGTTFAMAWETYALTPDANGRVRWRVELKRERGNVVDTVDMRLALSGDRRSGSRVRSDEPDASDGRYEREAPATPVVLEYLRFGLGDAGVGRHVVTVRVTDLVSGKITARSVGVRVLERDAQRRSSSNSVVR